MEDRIDFMVVDSTFNIVVILKPTIDNVDLINGAATHELTLRVGIGNECDGVGTAFCKPTGEP